MPPQEKLTRDPAVLLDVVFEEGLLFFEFSNRSDRPAYKVRVEFSKEIAGSRPEKPLSKIRLWKGLELLAPRRSLRVFIATSRVYFKQKQPFQFTATVRYHDADGGRWRAEIPHDVGVYRDFPYIRRTDARRRDELPEPRTDKGR